MKIDEWLDKQTDGRQIDKKQMDRSSPVLLALADFVTDFLPMSITRKS